MESIDCYFDYRSPFAYIASEVLPRFAERVGVSLRWKPIDLMSLSNYENGLPYSAVKRRYVFVDGARSAEFHGVSIRMPKPHPVESASALRLSLVALDEPGYLDLQQSLFRAAWRDQHDLGKREVLCECVSQVKGPVEEWLRRADLRETSELLDHLTAEAESKGVFGVPSMILGNELFWGLDSLPTLEWRLGALSHPNKRPQDRLR